MKKLFALLLVVFLFGGSTMAFAWWDQLETTDETITIGVGEGVTLQQSVDDSLDVDEVLVPSNVVQKTNDVNEVVFTYTVELDLGSDVTSKLDLAVNVDNIKVGTELMEDSFVNVDYTNLFTDFTVTGQEVTITVSLDDVDDVDENNEPTYNIQGEDITFDVTFTATIVE